MKRPSFQFYPGDWLNDSALRVVSVGARGAWMDMICVMHQAQPYGYLKVNHKVILTVNLARMIGATLSEAAGYLSELDDAGVFSRDADGCIFSRRMIRDEELRQVRAAGGILGGNPALKQDKTRLTLEVKQNPTPSSSSSSSSSKEKRTRAKSLDVTFSEFMQQREGAAIPQGHPVFKYADTVGIPREFLTLAWLSFEKRYSGNENKKYKAWPTVFKTSVEQNWSKLWFIDNDGGYRLTTSGMQLQREQAAK